MTELNKRIKARRKSQNKTLLEVAEFVGVKEATMQRYESGEIKTIPYDNIELIAEYLNCSPAYLMGWDNISNENELNIRQQNLYDTIIKLDDDKINLAIRILHSILDEKEQ